MKSKLTNFCPALAIFLFASAFALNRSPAIGQTRPDSAAPTTRVISASDKSAVMDAMPKPVKVVGTVDKTGVDQGTFTINFKNTDKSQFYAVILRQNRDVVNASFDGDIAKTITGKTLLISGTVTEYHGKPEIIISTADQLKFTDKSAADEKALDASDTNAIHDALGLPVTVTAILDNIDDGDSVLTINFKDTADSQLYAVVLRSARPAVDSGFNGDVAKVLIAGKSVRVTGRIVEYRGRPEIIISKPGQLEIVANNASKPVR